MRGGVERATRRWEWRAVVTVVTILMAAAAVAAQDATAPPFDAVSIRPQQGSPSFIPSTPRRFVDANATLRSLVTWAWDVRGFQVEGGPEWADSRRFDVSATTPVPVSQQTMRQMVRQMLADRFGLKVRIETREMPRYVLRTAREGAQIGPSLQPATQDCAAVLAERFGAPAPAGSNEPACLWRIGISPPVARMMVDGAPMREFAMLLERLVDRKVIDGTGLPGAFDIRLEFESAQVPMAVPPSDTPAAARDGLSLFTALQDQLGLELRSDRGAVDVIVIESATLPGPN